jgi:hypothetical protein
MDCRDGSRLLKRYRIRNTSKIKNKLSTHHSFKFPLNFNLFKRLYKLKINYGTKINELLVSFYLLMVGKKGGFEVVVVDRGVVVREVDGVVEVVDVVPVVVRVVVEKSVILGTW